MQNFKHLNLSEKQLILIEHIMQPLSQIALEHLNLPNLDGLKTGQKTLIINTASIHHYGSPITNDQMNTDFRHDERFCEIRAHTKLKECILFEENRDQLLPVWSNGHYVLSFVDGSIDTENGDKYFDIDKKIKYKFLTEKENIKLKLKEMNNHIAPTPNDTQVILNEPPIISKPAVHDQSSQFPPRFRTTSSTKITEAMKQISMYGFIVDIKKVWGKMINLLFLMALTASGELNDQWITDLLIGPINGELQPGDLLATIINKMKIDYDNNVIRLLCMDKSYHEMFNFITGDGTESDIDNDSG
jgi:hypothetical protein